MSLHILYNPNYRYSFCCPTEENNDTIQHTKNITMKPLIHYLFRHTIDMKQGEHKEEAGVVEREFIHKDPRLARDAALNYYEMYLDVLHQTDVFNAKMEHEHFVKSLHGHRSPADVAATMWGEADLDSEVKYDCKDEPTAKKFPILLLIMDESLADENGSTELLFKDNSEEPADVSRRFKNLEKEKELYAKAKYVLW